MNTSTAVVERTNGQQSAAGTDDITRGLFVVASAPAGWYEVDDVTRRWFDGRQWTDHYAPILSIDVDIYSTPTPTRSHPNHGFHLIMLIMTIGAWAPVWFGVTVIDGIRPVSTRLLQLEPQR